MFIRKRINKSGSISVVVVDKSNGKFNEFITIGIARDENELSLLEKKGKEWIKQHKLKTQPELDLFEEEKIKKERSIVDLESFLANIVNIQVNGKDLILNQVFDSIGFHEITDTVFRQLVKSRLSCPSSKAATVEYLKNMWIYQEFIAI